MIKRRVNIIDIEMMFNLASGKPYDGKDRGGR
jgi:hypothetical protein